MPFTSEMVPAETLRDIVNQQGRETVVAAAIQAHGVTFSVPSPGRHHDVLNKMSQDLGLDTIELGQPDAQGFLTSSGRFLGRIGAAQMAKDAGQIEKLNWPPYLYSEDLW